MFYKGTLKSYNPETESGLICLSGQDIELNFALKDFPNASLTPEPGERVKCLVEDRHGRAFAKYIVRLDHKNAKTEFPKASDPTHKSSAIDSTRLSDDDTWSVSTHLTQIDAVNHAAQQQKNFNTAKRSGEDVQTDDLKIQAQHPSDTNQSKLDHQRSEATVFNYSDFDQHMHSDPAKSPTNAEYATHTKASHLAVKTDLDSIPIEQFDMRPADLDVKGTIDLTKRFKTVNDPFEELYPTRSPAEKVKLAADPIDEFEELQRQIRGNSDRQVTDHYTYNHEVNQKQQHSHDEKGSSEEPNTETSFRHKIKIKKPSQKFRILRLRLKIPPYVVLSTISVILLIGLTYLGFQKYLKHKAEQDARAQYYLLEQQKAIEEQSKRMSKLSKKDH